MKTKPIVMAIGALLLSLAPVLFGQSAEKHMTDKEAVKLIADLPAMSQWFKDRGKAIESDSSGSIASALLMDKDFKSFLAKRGWTPERFSYVSGTAFGLLIVVANEKQSPEVIKQFDDAIAQIKDSDMPADQKAENIKNMNDAKAAMLGVSKDKEINQDELAIVRAHYSELMKVSDLIK
jgi:hypothetical protein